MEERSLLDYWMVLYRRRLMIALTVLSAVGFAIYLSSILPKVYEARASIYVPRDPDVVNFFSTDASKSISPRFSAPPPRQDEQAAYIGMLKSETVAKRVLEAYPHKSLDRLRKDSDFELSTNRFLEIYVRDKDPQAAADVANAYIRAFNEMISPFSGHESAVRGSIERQLEETKNRLATARIALQSFQERYRIADVKDETSELIKQRSSFEAKIEDAKAQLQSTEQQIVGLQEQLRREASLYVPSELITTNPLVETLKKDLTDLEASAKGTATEVQPRHPEALKLKAQYEAKKSELAKEIRKIVGSRTKSPGSVYETLRRDLANSFVDRVALEARLVGLAKTVSGIQARFASLPKIQVQHDALVSDVNIYQKLVETLSTDLEESRAQAKRVARGAKIVDPATAPEGAVFPIVWLNAVVAGMLALIGSIFYCFFLDYIERALEARRMKRMLVSPVAARIASTS